MKKFFLFWFFFLSTYLLVAGNSNFKWHTTSRNYFSLQAYSWVKGHLDLVIKPKDIHDLSIFQGKLYLYWPPLSTLLILPLVVFFGRNISDIFYTAFFGSFNPVLLYFVINKAKKIGILPKIPENYILLLTLFYAFGTITFYLSVSGTVWFTSQIISQIPLLLSIYFLFFFLEKNYYRYFIISIVFLILAFWGRYQLILYIPFHFLTLISKKRLSRKILFTSFVLVLLNLILFFIYNYSRFGNIFETGWRYQNYSPRFGENIKRYGMVNFRYILQNVYYFLVNPVGLSSKFPFINPDPSGNSIFNTSPLFLLILIGFFKKLHNLKYYFIILGSCVIVILSSLLTYYTGWFQFGYRYSLDIMPLLIFALCFWINRFSKYIVFILFSLSLLVNILGIYWWQKVAPFLR